MILVFGALDCILAIWLIVSPFLFGYAPAAIAVSACIGVVLAIAGFAMTKQRTKAALAKLGVALGAVSIVAGIVFLVLYGQGVNLIVVGLLAACVDIAALPFMVEAKEAKFFNKMGSDLARVTTVKTGKTGDITAKVVLLGSMPETIYVRPQELIKMLALMDDSVIKGIVGYIVRGYKANRAEAAGGTEAKQ